MLLKDLPWSDAPPRHPLDQRARDLAAALLRALGAVLDRLAHRLVHVETRGAARALAEPMLEFHAEAGAPEGALYVNGRLVGHLEGVRRL